MATSPITSQGRGIVVGNLNQAPSGHMVDCASNDVQIARGDYYAMNGTTSQTSISEFVTKCDDNGIVPWVVVVGIDQGNKASLSQMLDAADWIVNDEEAELGLFSEP